jgi:hypothetical protein
MMSRSAGGASLPARHDTTTSTPSAPGGRLKARIREIVKRVPLLGRPLVERDELRALVQKLYEPPGHFYSPIPDLAEIRRSDDEVFGSPSRSIRDIDLNQQAQLALFDALVPFYREQPFSPDERPGLRYFFENKAFSYFDAIVYHCLIRHLRPRRVIEVGSGYSSCALLDTNERFFNHSIACTFIEPYPQLLNSLLDDNDRARTTLIARNLQDVDTEIFGQLSANDILFIDASHVVKTHSDVNHVFFEVLPRLQDGVYIHFHDIFYPFEYPKEWVYQGRSWNEAYLLRAFLQNNSRYSIQLFNSFVEIFYRDRVERDMPLCLRYSRQSIIPTSAQSVWLKKLQG